MELIADGWSAWAARGPGRVAHDGAAVGSGGGRGTGDGGRGRKALRRPPGAGAAGAPVGACARGPLARAMIGCGPGAGGLGPPSSPPGCGRCRPTVSGEIRRGAGAGRGPPPGGGAGRGPGALGPPQDPQTGRRPGPARAGRRPARGTGAGPQGGSPPARGWRTPMTGGACAPVRKQIHPGAGCVQGAAGPRLPVAGGGGPAHRTHPPRPPLPAGRRSPGPGARSPMPGAPPTGLRPPRGRRGGRARALGGRPDHRRATPGSALITPAGAPQPVRADHPGGGAAAGSR